MTVSEGTRLPERPDGNMWAQTAAEVGREEADGTFDLAVKASVAVRGYALSFGCPVLAGHVAKADAPLVTALRRHGARVVGTTNLHELAFGITSANAWLGPVRHPHDAQRSAGGSSGGSAAAVARGAADLAIGGDTGGSVTIPASVCGVVGFRPTTGRYPEGGQLGMSWTRDTAGFFARHVATIVTADGWVTGSGAAAAALGSPPARRRLAVPVEYVEDLHPHTADAWARARASAEVEWDLVEVSLAPVLDLLRRPAWQTVGFESRVLFAQAAAEALGLPPDQAWRELLDGIATPDVAESLRRSDAAPVSPEAYDACLRQVFAAREEYAAILGRAGCAMALFPSTPRPATRVGQDEEVTHGGRPVHVFTLMTRNTFAGTLLRAPMLTLPVGVDPGRLPVGVTLQGLPFRDADVLATGALLETALRVA